MRKEVADWLQRDAKELAVIGGDLNMSVFSLEEHFETANDNGVTDPTSPYNILYENYKKHGDIATTKNLTTAHSIPTHVNGTSKHHFMVAVACPPPERPQ